MTEYEEITEQLVGAEGISIFQRQIRAENERARLVIAHGLGEHSGRYGNVIETIIPLGVSVWASDHRGHGRSGGPKGHVASFDHYLSDLSLTVQSALQDKPEGAKLFLLGHSLGGLIALGFAIDFPELLDGVIASSPLLGLVKEVPATQRALGKVMSAIHPGFAMGNGLDRDKLSHDRAAVEAYINDPLVHDRVSARWFTEMLKTLERVNSAAPQMTTPTLMQVAGDDFLVDARASRDFFGRLGVEDKTIHWYDGLYHEIFNETKDQRTKVLADLVRWLEERI